MNHKENDIVLPGEILCTYEEYIPSDWTYVEEGYIKASIYGKIIIDDKEKTIQIESDNAPEHIKLNDLVICHVTEVKQHKVLVTIKKIIGSNRDLITDYKGYVHISRATDDYVVSIHNLFKIGDIVEAKVIAVSKSGYVELTTADESLGVIKAMCVNCRHFMYLNNDYKLSCNCGLTDSRKISNKYGEY